MGTTASGSNGARATGRTATRGRRAQTRWRSQIDYGELCTTKYSYRSKYTLYTTKSGRYAGLVAQRRRDVSDELDARYGFLTVYLSIDYLLTILLLVVKPGPGGPDQAGPDPKPGPEPSRALARARGCAGSGFWGPGSAGSRASGPARTSLHPTRTSSRGSRSSVTDLSTTLVTA